VVGIPLITWAAADDQSGTYGLDKVQCELVTISGPAPFSLRSMRAWFKVMRFISEL
jgi:hypothetical protein